MDRNELQELRAEISWLKARIEQLEKKLGSQPPVATHASPQPSPVLVEKPVPPQQPAEKRRSAVPRESWEQKIGGTWLNRLGVVALLIGLAFFLKYAFDNNWINEYGRVIIGYAAGALLLAGGFWYHGRGKLPKFGAGLGGAGIGAWFISTWAAYNYYQIMAQIPAFAVMIAVTVAGVALALYWNSPAIAGLGLLGGYLTPFLIQGAGGHLVQFTYLLILNAGALAVLVKKNWNGLGFISLGFTTLINAYALITLYESSYLVPFMLFISAYHLLFALQGLAANLLHRSCSRPPVLGISVISGVFYALYSAILLYAEHKNTLALVLLAWGLLYLVQLAAVGRWRSEDKHLGFVLLSLALGYITLAVPVYFSKAWITMAWTILAMVLIASGWKSHSFRIRGWGLVILSFAFWRLVILDLKLFFPIAWVAGDSYLAPWSARLPATFLVLAVMLITAWLFRGERVTKFERALVPWLATGANLLCLFFLLGEWTRWFYYLGNGYYLWSARRATAWTLTIAGNIGLLVALWARWKYKPLKILTLILLPVAFVWSGLADARILGLGNSVVEFISPWAGRLPGAILLAGLSFLAVWLFGRKRLGWLVIMANIFILLVVTTEFSRYFYLVRDTLAQPWHVYRNAAWSAVVSGQGLILVALGIWRKDTLLRRMGIIFLLITVAKIILVDLTGLETVWRILVFLGTGAILILASWLYQKFVGAGLEKKSG